MSASSWIGQTISRRYQLVELLGRGGMSAVYKANDPNLRRTVAIKLIHPHLAKDPQFVRRFEEEAAAVARLRHPDIIQVFDFANDDDVYYMVLEYIPGQTLETRLKELAKAGQTMSMDQALSMGVTLCTAVDYAHRQGLIHRDLKPGNVMITPKGQTVLMDFGIAKILGSNMKTADGSILGTASYMSPEQIKAKSIDYRTDIYSLGVMLFEMVSGQLPYQGANAPSVMIKHLNQPVPDIRGIREDVPPLLAATLQRAMSKQPEARFQSSGEMAAVLRQVQEKPRALAPVAPTPTPVPNKSRKRAKRANRRLVWAAVLGGAMLSVFCLMVVAVAIILTQANYGRATPTEIAVVSSDVETNLPDINTGESDSDVEPTAEIEATETPSPRLTPTPIPGPTVSSLGMVLIEGAIYPIGTDGTIDLHTFWIDRYETTNVEYASFVDETGIEPPASWSGDDMPEELAQHPVRGVTWQHASDYCDWADKRLPTEAEWEVAARGPHGWRYPWGDKQLRVELGLPVAGTYAVGSYPANRSYFGVFDMSGNVWEWVAQPYSEVGEGQQIMRGGNFSQLRDAVDPLAVDPNNVNFIENTGFRCATNHVAVEPELGVIQYTFADFAADAARGWRQASEATGGYFIGYHLTDFYHVDVGQANDCLSVFNNIAYENLTIESDNFVRATDGEGDFRYGLAVTDDGVDFYALLLSPRQQKWYVVKNTAEGMILLDESMDSSIDGLDPETGDRLLIIVNGPELTFFVNGRYASRIINDTLDINQVGYVVQTLDESHVHIHYDTLILRQLPENLPVPDEDATEPIDLEFSPICKGSYPREKDLVNYVDHEVQEGESLGQIANEYGVSEEAVLNANNLSDDSRIRPGSTILIPLPGN